MLEQVEIKWLDLGRLFWVNELIVDIIAGFAIV